MHKSTSIFAVLLVGLLGAQWAKADSCNNPANLVQNCSFSAGGGSFNGWSGSATTSGFDGIDTGYAGAITPTPYGGSTYEAYLGDLGGTATLSQTLATVVGQEYTISFALQNTAAAGQGYLNSFLAMFGGKTLLSLVNVGADGYTLYTYKVDATSTSTLLSFTDENDAGYWELDDIDVVATPEPSTLLLLGTGLLALACLARWRPRLTKTMNVA